jgi:hypothetical protein
MSSIGKNSIISLEGHGENQRSNLMEKKFKKFWEGLIAYFHLIAHDRIENKNKIGGGAQTTKRSHKPPNKN